MNDNRKSIVEDITNTYPVTGGLLIFPETGLVVSDETPATVYKRVLALFTFIVQEISNGKLPCINVPMNHSKNAIYDDKRNVFLGNQERTIKFEGSGIDQLLRILRVAEIVLDLTRKNIHATKREIFYSDVNVFGDQRNSDRACEELSRLLRVRRKNLMIVAAPRGLICGKMVLVHENTFIDLENAGEGWQVDPFINKYEIVESKAAFVLLVEKHDIYMKLSRSRWFDKYPCIIATSKGIPTLNLREFLSKVVGHLHIPLFILTDGDPGGIQFALTVARGSISHGTETPWLACNHAWWIGVHPGDVEAFSIDEADCNKVTKGEREHIDHLLGRLKLGGENDKLQNALKSMQESGITVSLECISRKEAGYLEEIYIPTKLSRESLIPL